jgi:hypothetical protein
MEVWINWSFGSFRDLQSLNKRLEEAYTYSLSHASQHNTANTASA